MSQNPSPMGSFCENVTYRLKRLGDRIRNNDRVERARSKVREKMQVMRYQAQELGQKATERVKDSQTFQSIKERLKRSSKDDKKADASEQELQEQERRFLEYMQEKKEQTRRAEMEKQLQEERLGKRTILRAAELGDMECVTRLVDLGQGMFVDPDTGTTALHAAAAGGRAQVVEFLLSMTDLDVDIQDKSGCTPLLRACQNGRLALVRKLQKDHAASMQRAKAYWGATALHFAAEQGQIRMCEYLLLEGGLDILAQSDVLETPYEVVCRAMRGPRRATTERALRNVLHDHVQLGLAEAQSKIGSSAVGSQSAADDARRLALAQIVDGMHEDWVEEQLEKGQEDAKTVLSMYELVRNKKPALLDDMLAEPLNRDLATEARDETHGRSMLHLCAVLNDPATAEVLFDSTYLSPDDTDGRGRTALHLAALYSNVEMAHMLIDNQFGGPEGKAELIAARDDNGKRASELIGQRFKHPRKHVRRERRHELEYLLDPDRRRREREEMEELRKFEQQVDLSKFYHQSGLKTPAWVAEHGDEISSKLASYRTKKLHIERRRKLQQALVERRAAREELRMAELRKLAASSTKARETLQGLLASHRTKHGPVIELCSTEIEKKRVEVCKREETIQQNNKFMHMLHPRVAVTLAHFTWEQVTAEQEAIVIAESDIAGLEREIVANQQTWRTSDEMSKAKVVSDTAVEQLNLRIEAAAERYGDQLRIMEIGVNQLAGSMVPDKITVQNRRQALESGEVEVRRRGRHAARRREFRPIAPEEVTQYEAEITKLTSQLAVDEKRLTEARAAIADKKNAWALRNDRLWFDFASARMNRNFAKFKREVHRAHQERIHQCKMEVESLKSTAERIDEDIAREEMLGKRYCFCSRWRRFSQCHLENLQEDHAEVVSKIEILLARVEKIQDEELEIHERLRSEHEEMLHALRSEIKLEAIAGDIADAIELPFISASDTETGSEADSNDDVLSIAGNSISEVGDEVVVNITDSPEL